MCRPFTLAAISAVGRISLAGCLRTNLAEGPGSITFGERILLSNIISLRRALHGLALPCPQSGTITVASFLHQRKRFSFPNMNLKLHTS